MRHKKVLLRIVAGAIIAFGTAALSASSLADISMVIVDSGMLCVTEGALHDAPRHQFSVDAPKMRAYVNRPSAQIIEARFTYVGPTAVESKLGSGEAREQFGLKLRAQDPCNLVYAMWRIEPESKLVISVKLNPGQHTSAECGNQGYTNIKPVRALPAPTLRPGTKHSLRAEMDGENLRVFADGTLVWRGDVGPDAAALDGPVGIRSDNAALDGLQLMVGAPPGAPSAAQPGAVLPCKSGPAESE